MRRAQASTAAGSCSRSVGATTLTFGGRWSLDRAQPPGRAGGRRPVHQPEADHGRHSTMPGSTAGFTSASTRRRARSRDATSASTSSRTAWESLISSCRHRPEERGRPSSAPAPAAFLASRSAICIAGNRSLRRRVVCGVTAPQFAIVPTPLGAFGAVWNEAGIARTWLHERTIERTRAQIRRSFPTAEERDPPTSLAAAMIDVAALLAGERRVIGSTDLDLRAIPEFDRRVYEVAQDDPAGPRQDRPAPPRRRAGRTRESPAGASSVLPITRRSPARRAATSIIAAASDVGGITLLGGREGPPDLRPRPLDSSFVQPRASDAGLVPDGAKCTERRGHDHKIEERSRHKRHGVAANLGFPGCRSLSGTRGRPPAQARSTAVLVPQVGGDSY